MDQNPYQPPMEDTPREPERREVHRPGLATMAVMGVLMGMCIIAAAGAVCCFVLGVALAACLAVALGWGNSPPIETWASLPMMMFGVGGIAGALTGIPIGLLLGVLARYGSEAKRRQLVVTSCTLNGLAGGMWGAAPAWFATTRGPAVASVAALLIVPAAGVVAGIVGGRLLANALARLAWEVDPAPPEGK